MYGFDADGFLDVYDISGPVASDQMSILKT